MSVQHYKNGQLSIIAGAGGFGGGEESFTGTKAEVEQAISAGQIKENWTVYITDDIEEVTPNASNYKIEYITQENYDALPEDKYTNDIEYHITDGGISNVIASNIEYDNATSGLEAINVQNAVDELKENVNTLNESLENNFLSGYYVDNNGVTIPHDVGSTTETDILAVFNQLAPNQTWMGFIRNDSMKHFCIMARASVQQRGMAIVFFVHTDRVRYYRFQDGAIIKNADLNMTDVTT